jgi:hypothetical protein
MDAQITLPADSTSRKSLGQLSRLTLQVDVTRGRQAVEFFDGAMGFYSIHHPS